MTRPRTPARARPKNLVLQVRQVVARMSWLADTDQALVETAVQFADTIESALADAEVTRRAMRAVLDDESASPEAKVRASEVLLAADAQASRTVRLLGHHLVDALKALGAAPAERRALDLGGRTTGRLAHLRAVRAGQNDD